MATYQAQPYNPANPYAFGAPSGGTQYDWFHDPNNPYSYYYRSTPNAPGYQAGYDPNTMGYAGELEKRLGGLKMDMRGLEAFRDMALRKGPSKWANLMTGKQYMEEADARERAKREAKSSRAEAESELAMRGGLSSGARERVATSGMRNLLAMSQDVSRQGNLNRMQIGINDEQNRIQALSQLPGFEKMAYDAAVQKEGMYSQARQADIQRLIEENNRRNQYNQNLYNQQMQAWAAQRQAQATENAGKK